VCNFRLAALQSSSALDAVHFGLGLGAAATKDAGVLQYLRNALVLGPVDKQSYII
jgi:hypothetical protein